MLGPPLREDDARCSTTSRAGSRGCRSQVPDHHLLSSSKRNERPRCPERVPCRWIDAPTFLNLGKWVWVGAGETREGRCGTVHRGGPGTMVRALVNCDNPTEHAKNRILADGTAPLPLSPASSLLFRTFVLFRRKARNSRVPSSGTYPESRHEYLPSTLPPVRHGEKLDSQCVLPILVFLVSSQDCSGHFPTSAAGGNRLAFLSTSKHPRSSCCPLIKIRVVASARIVRRAKWAVHSYQAVSEHHGQFRRTPAHARSYARAKALQPRFGCV